MKKTFRLKELDCANCAAKMEKAINKMSDVQNASINFMTQKLTLEANDDVFDQVVTDAEKAMRKIEPDVRIVGA